LERCPYLTTQGLPEALGSMVSLKHVSILWCDHISSESLSWFKSRKSSKIEMYYEGSKRGPKKGEKRD